MPELQCETVDDHYILRDGAAGLFLAASQFPRNRETRAPLVAELLPHASEIDPKYAYLMDAPAADDVGNPSIVRYSRKTAEIYVQSEIDKKASGWKAFYTGGAWKEDDLLAVHKTDRANDGDIIVARIDEEVTVKRLKKGKTPYTLSLIAENPDFAPIEVDVRLNEFAIEGISVGVIRRH